MELVGIVGTVGFGAAFYFLVQTKAGFARSLNNLWLVPICLGGLALSLFLVLEMFVIKPMREKDAAERDKGSAKNRYSANAPRRLNLLFPDFQRGLDLLICEAPLPFVLNENEVKGVWGIFGLKFREPFIRLGRDDLRIGVCYSDGIPRFPQSLNTSFPNVLYVFV
jgi:hypothetical protein